MTVNVSKSQFNIREKLKDLERPSTDKLVQTNDDGKVYIDKLGGVVSLSNIHRDIADTAVDVFVYDTSKDSDGGAWRKRTQYTSWYNETLGTTTRGTRKEFPAVAVIVTTLDDVIIYDGDDPDLPMWIKFESGDSGSAWENYYLGRSTSFSGFGPQIRASAMLNGRLVVGKNGAAAGNFTESYTEINFISDNALHRDAGSAQLMNNSIVSRNGDAGGYYNVTSTFGVIVQQDINDVAMTVLPNAPIDSATGLPIPTIAVATAGGVSIIKDDGSVVDITASAGGSYHSAKFISISSDGFLVFPQHGSSATSGEYSLMTIPIPTSDRTTQTSSGNATDKYIFNDTNVALTALPHGLGVSQNGALRIPGTQFLNYPNGLAILDENPTSLANAMVAHIKFDYNTGWMQGQVRGAYLSDTDDTNKTNGQTDPDRSMSSNLALTVTGSITKSAVATGAELVGYSGWSSSNYMDNTSYAVDFGNPVTISIVFWQKLTDIADYGYGVSFSHGNTIKGGISNGSSASGYGGQGYFNMGSQTLFTGSRIDDGNWHCLVGTINSDGNVKKFYLDGKEVASATINNHDMSGISRIHVGSYGINHAYAHRGSLALLRVSKSVPSPEQIKKMYNDEKHLFVDNAKCTLYGSSDAVTALAFDEVTDQLHVGTSSGRSDFQGLRRINNTTTAVTTAISAHDEFIIEQ